MHRILLHITTVPETLAFFRGQVSFMRGHGFRVEALTSPGECYPAPEVLREFDTVYRVAMPRSITPVHDLQALRQVVAILRHVRPTIVHAHTPKGGLLGMLGAALSGVPVRLYHIHGSPFITARGWKRQLLRATESLSCRLASQVLCVSNSVRDLTLQAGVCPAIKVKVLGYGSINGVDTQRFNPAEYPPEKRRELRQSMGIPAQAPVVGFVGRLVHDKGVDELANAWLAIKQTIPKAQLLIVGPFEKRDAVSAQTRAYLEQDPSIHLAGVRQDMPAVYSMMDLLVLPTYREGLPYAPLEGSAMGLPVLATRVPGCVDVVRDGETGTLIPPGDSQTLAAAIIRYLQAPELRRRHGQDGREFVSRCFAPEAVWEATLAEYQRLLKTAGIPPLPTPED